MTKLFKKMPSWALVLLVVIIAISGGVIAQQTGGVQTAQQSQRFDAAALTCSATGAGNTTITCTLTPLPGQYVYVHTCTAHEVANAAITGAAGPAGVFTTTNLQNNLIWWADNATQVTGWQKEAMKEVWPNGLKTASPTTAFTLAQTGGQSTQSMRINCTGWSAP